MEITHLVVNGCSWTYCQGLEDPKTQGWPALLAKKLNIPVVNLAVPGSGNDTIHRRIYEYYFDDLPNNSKPLYIVGWSQSWRREAWCRKYYNKNLPQGYTTLMFPDKKPKNFYEAALLDNWSEEDFLRRTMLYQLSLDALFKSKNIPNLATFFAEYENQETDPILEKYKNIVDYLKTSTNTIDPAYRIVEHCEKLPCGHDGIEAMEIVSDFLYDALMTKYEAIIPVNDTYLSLTEFNDKDKSGSLVNSAWE
jgi:hypothetical protein